MKDIFDKVFSKYPELREQMRKDIAKELVQFTINSSY